MSSWRIAPFNSKVHDYSSFSCGAPELDAYIQRYASQDIKRDIARVYVACEEVSDTVAGYYSISASSFEPRALPPEAAKRLPKHIECPAVLLGRFAVDRRFQKQRLGASLMMNVFARVLRTAEMIGAHSLIVDALNEDAAQYYLEKEFIRFVDSKNRLFLPVRSIRKMAGNPA